MDKTAVIDTKVGVLDKAMSILQVFPNGEVALSPVQLAKYTKMPLPTVYRLAGSLCEHGMLIKEGQSFRLGMTLLRLGAMVAEGIDLRARALPHLRWLNSQTDENAELHIRSEETRMAIEVVRSSHNLRSFVDIGTPLPLHIGAGGKALLAWLPDREQDALIAKSIARFKRPLRNVEALKHALAKVRSTGWVSSEGERAANVSAIAAPVYDVNREVVGAMVLAAPTIRLGTKERSKFAPLVCEAASRTSRDMGYIPPKKQTHVLLAGKGSELLAHPARGTGNEGSESAAPLEGSLQHSS
ncbi:MAG TPA: IclR family transcriptional regulator [Ktedonobacteraceae bacterium]|nr:IclR family transcriptional regulator [Ktedonobacteraceae bacterium]